MLFSNFRKIYINILIYTYYKLSPGPWAGPYPPVSSTTLPMCFEFLDRPRFGVVKCFFNFSPTFNSNSKSCIYCK